MRVGAVSAVEIERLYRRRFAAFVGLAAAVTRDRGEAVDGVPDPFAKALRKRRSIRSPEPWLWRSGLNTPRGPPPSPQGPALPPARPPVHPIWQQTRAGP